MKKNIICASIILSSTLAFGFDFGSIAKEVIGNVTKDSTTNSSSKNTTNLSNSTVSSGLKEALKVGVDYAVKNLSETNGYLDNSLVKIPLPENLQKVETLIRKAGGDEIANDLIKSMNSAATNAAPKTAEVFVSAIEKMSLEDATKILNGDKNAATDYFKTNTNSSLKEVIKPIIQKTMEENSVAKYYNAFNSYYKQYGKEYVNNSEVMNLAKNFGVDSYLPSSSDENLDDYVTQKAIDGLFKMIAEKEAAIRSNPIEQTSSILKQVFGN
ncbi:DUF4197 domain-containing protein [Halarcobacter sp.]|uniref:DUF4197 domain-containing protein n=1 Tax=Halarcobacter sp. TaxID=2321133 RepID=UPI0029F462A3|nr:DUF4197 domain-containing protein [Halarcobacter sp.]